MGCPMTDEEEWVDHRALTSRIIFHLVSVLRLGRVLGSEEEVRLPLRVPLAGGLIGEQEKTKG